MPSKTDMILAYTRLAPVIPVVTIEDARRSIDLAQALVEAGLPVVEVTLRTPAALDAIAAIAEAVPEAVVAAGNIVRARQIGEAVDGRAKILVSPGKIGRAHACTPATPIPPMPASAS